MMKTMVIAVCLTVWFGTGFVPGAVFQSEDAYAQPALEATNSWSLIIVPDTQSYVKFARNQGICELMTAWIAENLEPLNVLSVLHVGDLVEQNNILKPNGKHGDQTGDQQWDAMSKAFERLDGKTPYILATGNHDYGINSAENRDTQFSKYFPVRRNKSWKGVFVECGPGFEGRKTLENAAYVLPLPQGRKALILSLEFAPSDEVLVWAKEVVARNEYKDHLGIILTHSYMRSLASKNVLVEKEGYAIKDVNYGQAIWDKLIYPSDNVRLVLCGHVAGVGDPRKNVGFREDKNHAGKMVSQMLFDTQTDGGGWQGNGGDGWLRILEFSADSKKVTVKTFSPFFAISPSTQHLAWRREPFNQFVFELE
ncbi:MAG: metallophosphoesterase [Kiritimatiellae bacterium]|nr:metallophosphoesterase [Kiritimatiellia bacterium]